MGSASLLFQEGHPVAMHIHVVLQLHVAGLQLLRVDPPKCSCDSTTFQHSAFEMEIGKQDFKYICIHCDACECFCRCTIAKQRSYLEILRNVSTARQSLI